jgi:hypothetical protein
MPTNEPKEPTREQALLRFKKRRNLQGHFVVYLVVNAAVWVIWGATGAGFGFCLKLSSARVAASRSDGHVFHSSRVTCWVSRSYRRFRAATRRTRSETRCRVGAAFGQLPVSLRHLAARVILGATARERGRSFVRTL